MPRSTCRRKLLSLQRDLMRARAADRLKPLHRESRNEAHVSGAVLVVGLARRRRVVLSGAHDSPASDGEWPLQRSVEPAAARVLYWHDPMVPGSASTSPASRLSWTCSCVPVYADSGGSNGVQVSAAAQQNLGIRYATVRRATMSSSFDAVGTVQFDERRNVAVQTRVAGYVERLAVRAPMERVRKGQALATVFAPDWLGPQNELIALKRAGVSDGPDRSGSRADARPVDSRRTGPSEREQPAPRRRDSRSSRPRTAWSPSWAFAEGVAVTPGMTLFRIAGLADSLGRGRGARGASGRGWRGARRSRRRCRPMHRKPSTAS